MDTEIEETEALYFEVIGQGASSLFADTTQIVVHRFIDVGRLPAIHENGHSVS